MSAIIIDGKQLAAKVYAEINTSRAALNLLNPPGLAVILVGDNPASKIYIAQKRKACQSVNFNSFYFELDSDAPEQKLLDLIDQLNFDPKVHGILVQLPLPAHINPHKVIERINPAKDVDGFHPYNIGRLAQRNPLIRPCTPKGIMRMLAEYKIQVTGKNAVIIGASNIVGRPMALELLLEGATVTVCHRFTQDLAKYCLDAEILVAAAGKPQLIKADFIKPGAVVIDVGMNRLADGRLVGDVEAGAAEVASYLTPVPSGVGPMTVAMLMETTLKRTKNLCC